MSDALLDVEITPDSRRRLAELSGHLDRSQGEILEEAIEALYGRYCPRTETADWSRFRTLIAAARAEPAIIRRGTADESLLRVGGLDQGEAEEWNRVWDGFEDEQKALDLLKVP